MDHTEAFDDYLDSTQFAWKDNSLVYLNQLGPKTVELCANAEGLRSLAAQMIWLADSDRTSIFYDTDPGDLEEGSLWLQITKVDLPGRANPSEEEDL